MNDKIPINYSPMKGIKIKSMEYEKVLFTSISLAQATSKFIDFKDDENTKVNKPRGARLFEEMQYYHTSDAVVWNLERL